MSLPPTRRRKLSRRAQTSSRSPAPPPLLLLRPLPPVLSATPPMLARLPLRWLRRQTANQPLVLMPPGFQPVTRTTAVSNPQIPTPPTSTTFRASTAHATTTTLPSRLASVPATLPPLAPRLPPLTRDVTTRSAATWWCKRRRKGKIEKLRKKDDATAGRVHKRGSRRAQRQLASASASDSDHGSDSDVPLGKVLVAAKKKWKEREKQKADEGKERVEAAEGAEQQEKFDTLTLTAGGTERCYALVPLGRLRRNCNDVVMCGCRCHGGCVKCGCVALAKEKREEEEEESEGKGEEVRGRR
ncbi:hypothetical protein BC567DRAFT_67708 [Phyllosticta citribraziliensis]